MSKNDGYDAHVEGEWITTQEPTETEPGSREMVCTVCGRTLATEEMPVIDPDHEHALSEIAAQRCV